MEFLKDSFLVIIRIATIFPLLLMTALYMGRRSIGELPVFDLLIIISLGSVVGADIADPNIEHIHTGVAIIAIGLLQKIFSTLHVRIKWFGKLITFEPVVVINKGKLIQKNLRKTKYSIDSMLQMLRENDVFDISEVEIAVLEGNGKLTVLKKTPSAEKQKAGLSYPVIIEGKIESKVLEQLNLQESWLSEQLKTQGIEATDVFFASINDKMELNFARYNSDVVTLPPIFH